MKKQYNLLEDRVRPLFFHYLLPSVSGTLVTAIYVLVDTIIVGKGINAQAVAGLNIVLPIFSLFYGTGMLFGVGGAVLFSFSKGRGEAEKAQGYFTAALCGVLGFAVMYMALFQCFFTPVTDALGAAPETRAYVDAYGRTIVWGAPFFMLSSFLQAFLRNDKAPRLAMAGTIVGGVTNIVLDVVFVFAAHWGMFGAAFATVIGNLLGVLVLCTHFFSRQNTLRLRPSAVCWGTPVAVVKNGFSSFLIEMSNGIVILLFNIQLMRYVGVNGVTAYSILSNTALMLISMSNGVSQAAQPIVATNYGGGRTKRVGEVKRLGLVCASVIGAAFTVFALCCPDLLTHIFIHPTEEVTTIAQPAIRLYAVSFFLAAVNLFLSNYFQGILKPGYAMAICLCRGLICNVPFLFMLPLLIGVNGIWLTVPLSETVTLLLAAALAEAADRRGEHRRNQTV